MQTGLQGKVALVTGASNGVGKSIAVALAQEGVRLALCAHDERELKITADEIQAQTHADIMAVKANTMKINDIRRFVNAAIKKFGRIDILVNNAESPHVGGIFETTDEEWENEIQLKLLGYIRVAREAAKFMKVNGAGRIINIVGMTGKEPAPSLMVPGIVNAALLNFTRSLSKELEVHRIRVNSISPDVDDLLLTDETIKLQAADPKEPSDEVHQSTLRPAKSGRISTNDIAQAVVYLSSDAAASINGISLNIDAGRSSGVW